MKMKLKDNKNILANQLLKYFRGIRRMISDWGGEEVHISKELILVEQNLANQSALLFSSLKVCLNETIHGRE
jgi:hypothetical protein